MGLFLTNQRKRFLAQTLIGLYASRAVISPDSDWLITERINQSKLGLEKCPLPNIVLSITGIFAMVIPGFQKGLLPFFGGD